MNHSLDDVKLNPHNKYGVYQKDPLDPMDIVVFIILLMMLCFLLSF